MLEPSKQRKRSAGTERIGVSEAALFFAKTRRWVFREQPVEDFGVDAHVEFAPDNEPTGRLVALQVKSGDSYLKPKAGGGWLFYPKSDDLNYWEQHSLPVAVIFWHEASNRLLGIEVSARTLERTTGNGWRLTVNDDHELTASRLGWLEELSDGNSYDLRLRELRLLLPLMQKIQSGSRVLVQADEWVNKTLNKRDMSVIEVDPNGNRINLSQWAAFTGPGSYGELIQAMFAWADVQMDPDVMNEAADYWDSEYDDLTLRPYSNSASEVDHWSVELTLGRLARAYLLVDDYARTGARQLRVPLV